LLLLAALNDNISVWARVYSIKSMNLSWCKNNIYDYLL
jgi:hypothetical protein